MARFYDSRLWRDRIRPTQLAEHPLCAMCARLGKVRPAFHVDHITPISKGGDPYDAANLQSLCAECHSRKTAVDEGKRVSLGCDLDGVPVGATHWR